MGKSVATAAVIRACIAPWLLQPWAAMHALHGALLKAAVL